MRIDTTAPTPPAECWLVTSDLVSGGQTPLLIKPIEWFGPRAGGMAMLKYRAGRRRPWCWASDCYATREAALKHAQFLARHARLEEIERHRKALALLDQVLEAS